MPTKSQGGFSYTVSQVPASATGSSSSAIPSYISNQVPSSSSFKHRLMSIEHLTQSSSSNKRQRPNNDDTGIILKKFTGTIDRFTETFGSCRPKGDPSASMLPVPAPTMPAPATLVPAATLAPVAPTPATLAPVAPAPVSPTHGQIEVEISRIIKANNSISIDLRLSVQEIINLSFLFKKDVTMVNLYNIMSSELNDEVGIAWAQQLLQNDVLRINGLAGV